MLSSSRGPVGWNDKEIGLGGYLIKRQRESKIVADEN
jgi:hypothetical protein